QNDPYPDAYCPQHPGVYEYVFDVLREVIDVFQPKHMHIGHDEYYSICVCDRCKDKSAPEIYANDITKIHDFLAERGIKTIIWSEKLLNSIMHNGRPVGGADKVYYFKGKPAHKIPATYPAIDMIPKDVMCMHWYWSIVEDWDQEFLKRGFYMFYGNYHCMAMPHAAARIAAGAKGGGPSNWSYATLEYLQQNCVLGSLAYAATLFWRNDHRDDQFTEYLTFCLKDLYKYRNLDILAGPHIQITHTSLFERPYEGHADGVFIDVEGDTLGRYVVTYTDGTTFDIPIVYALNIVGKDRYWTRGFGSPTGSADMGEARKNEQSDIYDYDNQLVSVSYTTLPEKRGEDTWFTFVTANPYPQKTIESINLVEKPGMEGKILVDGIRY
nr:family 20 glycosylhydrolase [bacterium]